MLATITITNEQKIKVMLNPKTPSNKPAALDAPPTWSVVDGDSTLNAAADGMSADLISGNAAGTSHYGLSAKAGGNQIGGTIELIVTGVPASSLGITLGPVLPK